MRPQDSRSPGPFFVGPNEGDEMEAEARHYLVNGDGEQPEPREALEWAGHTRAQMVDLKFCDLLGAWQHMTLPLSAFDEAAFDEGLGFDGSSIRGWQGISESDMLLMPDASSAVLDPFAAAPTLSLLCEIVDPITREPYAKDPRRIAKRAEEYLRETGGADTGSGMHTTQSLWKEGTPLMADKSGYAGLSQLARTYIGGLLAHAPALLAFCAPTTNSYRRLVPGYEAPVNLVYSQRNRSACIRIPMYSDSPKAKRIEFRCPDAAANPYLAFSAMLMAGLDGIEKGLDAGEPADWDLFEEDRGGAQVPGSLAEALDALETDHEFLLKGGVFSEELIRTWIDYKRENELDVVRLRPHPAEFALYYDC